MTIRRWADHVQLKRDTMNVTTNAIDGIDRWTLDEGDRADAPFGRKQRRRKEAIQLSMKRESDLASTTAKFLFTSQCAS